MQTKYQASWGCRALALAVGWGVAWGVAAEEVPADLAGLPLEPLVVVGRVAQSPWDLPGAVGVVDADALQLRDPWRAADALRTLPGVDVQGSAYPGTPVKPILRGQSPGLISKRILVLVDGRRVTDPFQGGVEFGLLDADAIERIEVLRGPASALYGSDAVAGVINIITRRGGPTPETTLRGVGGPDGLWRAQVAHGARQGHADYFVTASTLHTDGARRNPDGTRRDWHEARIAGNIGQDLGDGQELRAWAGYYEAEGRDDNSDRDIQKDHQQLEWSRQGSGAREARLTARVWRNGDDQRYDWTYPGVGRYDMQTLGADVQQSLWAHPRHRVTLGVDVRRESVDAGDVGLAIREDVDTVGAYVQDEWWMVDTLALTLGGRFDYDRDFGENVSPRAALLWRPDPRLEAFAGVARAYRAPSLSDRYFRGEFFGRVFEGNPDLDPETLMAYEIGARWRPASRLRLELTGFYNDLEDAFEFAPDEDGVYRNRNIARSHTVGLESGLRLLIVERLEAFVNHTYVEGELDRFPPDPAVEGNRLPYLAPHTFAAGLTWTDPRGGRHALTGRHVASRYSDDANSPDRKVEAYTVFDWRSRVPVGGQAALTLGVDNLFDESYTEFYGIRQPGVTVFGGFEVTL